MRTSPKFKKKKKKKKRKKKKKKKKKKKRCLIATGALNCMLSSEITVNELGRAIMAARRVTVAA